MHRTYDLLHTALGPKLQILEREEIDKIQEAYVAKLDVVEWVSQVVCVPLEGGCLRFCVNYCRLKMLTVRDRYPTQHLDERIDSLTRLARWVFSN